MNLNKYQQVILSTLMLFCFCFTASSQVPSSLYKVNEERLNRHIQELSNFGKGTDGFTSRVAYSEADLKGRAYVIELIKKAGLEVTIDFAGNIIGKREGTDPSKKPIAFGSHIDMVPNGGNYDGCVGSISAIEVVQTLKENDIATEHPLEVIIFSNEEGGVIGSRAMVGQLSEDVLKAVSHSGLTVEEGIKVIGGNMKNANPRKPGDLTAFLELHIEQGGSLDREKIQIGVVEGIVGFRVWDVIIEGFANHAGTTPMNLRNDALLVAAEVILMVNREVKGMEGQQVGTIGQINAVPGAPNVIPGKVILSLEIRDLAEEKIEKLITLIEANTTEIAKRTGSTITIRDRDFFANPALMDERIKDQIIKSANLLGLSYKNMPSGAGHDAQEMAKIAPSGMIFIPSVNGISHSPKEFTKGIDIANGANVLLNTILELDKKL